MSFMCIASISNNNQHQQYLEKKTKKLRPTLNFFFGMIIKKSEFQSHEKRNNLHYVLL